MSTLTFTALKNRNSERSVEWGGSIPDLKDLIFTAVELGGEADEVLNAVKKLERWNRDVKGGVPLTESLQDIADALADVVICADRVALALGIDLGTAVVKKFNETSEKHNLETKLIMD